MTQGVGQRILVVDDEPQILRALGTTLRGAGYTVDTADTAEGALASAAAQPPAGVILDLVLPDGSGTDVCRELRRWSDAPVIVLSAVGEEKEKIAALDAGADDYVMKPFSVDELLARLRAVLRRTAADSDPVIEIGGLRIDVAERVVSRDGERIKLTPHEFDLLRVLAQNPGKLLTHRMLLREVWGPAYASEAHYLHVYVSHLRAKVGPELVVTEPGAGYRLLDPATS
ncbi:MAG TPA: response regulator transcription factor [Gaiellaceae bacterium]|jgi:two-component system KDP operon response regulator KdpE|nr:response regulator transcription factor [Gaiellaceae bacterium]